MSFQNWTEGVTEVCSAFQADLSCLVDGELDQGASARAMLHLESCPCCRDFVEDTRRQVQLHRDMADPDRLLARVAMLTGSDLAAEAVEIDLNHRLATIFYQLGKAYVLAGIDEDFRTRVFEAAVPLRDTQLRGRGFVDGVLQTGRGEGRVDWRHARHMLNGRLEQIASPLEKGRKLLEEAVATEPDHEEARLYLAFLHAHEGRRLKAADEYRAIFETAVDPSNRGHAAIQLGRLYAGELEFRKAAACFRWLTISGLADQDDRFFVARFNIGMMYAQLRQPRRALSYFRELLDRHSARAGEIAALFAKSPRLRECIDAQPGFAEALLATCPELFRPAPENPDTDPVTPKPVSQASDPAEGDPSAPEEQ